MFHENLLRYNPEAVLFILNGPISSDAPYATEEQPGPKDKIKKNQLEQST